jgi:hypothetical protein
LNVVTINGNFQPIGRYPKQTAANGGYLTVSSFSGNTTISSAQLSGSTEFSRRAGCYPQSALDIGQGYSYWPGLILCNLFRWWL